MVWGWMRRRGKGYDIVAFIDWVVEIPVTLREDEVSDAYLAGVHCHHYGGLVMKRTRTVGYTFTSISCFSWLTD